MKKMATSSRVVDEPVVSHPSDDRPVAGDPGRDHGSGISDPPPAEQVQMIPLERLVDSRSNPRRTMNNADLEELAASIREHGIQVPLLVRPGWANLDSGLPAYEIVCGHRRAAAAAFADHLLAPCLVREMDDAMAAEIALIDNLQRVDVPALEEAEAFGRLLDAPGATVESVAAKLAKSASYVSRRLKLLDAIEPVRSALQAGAIEIGHALEIARLSADQQERLLARLNVGYAVKAGDDDDDEVESDTPEPGQCRFCGAVEDDQEWARSWVDEQRTVCSKPDCAVQWKFEVETAGKWERTSVSVQELKRTIAQWSLKDLSAAPFPLDHTGLGEMPCTVCPKRSSNSMLLFNDLAGSDTCTDRACFDRKATAFVQLEVIAAAQARRKLVKITEQWGAKDKDTLYYNNVRILKSEDECPSAVAAIWIDGTGIGQRIAICHDEKCTKHNSGRGYSSASRVQPSEKEKTERKAKLAKLNNDKKYRAALFQAVARAPIAPRAASGLNLEVCLYAIGRGPGQYNDKAAEALGWPKDVFAWNGHKALRERVAKLSEAERLRAALVAAHAGELAVNEYAMDSKPADLETLAGLLNVDTKKIRAGLNGDGKPGAAAAGKQKPAEKKAILSVAAKKRIAAAQKKRWATARKAGRK